MAYRAAISGGLAFIRALVNKHPSSLSETPCVSRGHFGGLLSYSIFGYTEGITDTVVRFSATFCGLEIEVGIFLLTISN